MKRKILLLIIVLALLPCYIFAEQKKAKPNPPYALARGFANVLTCWLEVPRGLIYENARIPIIGFFTGTVKGGFLTMYRAVAGTIDIAAMGLTKEGLYFNDFPDFVWDAEWIPPCGEDLVDSKNLEYSSCTTCNKNKPCYMLKQRLRPPCSNRENHPMIYRKNHGRPAPPPPPPHHQQRKYRRMTPPPPPPPPSEDWDAENSNPKPFGLYVSAADDAKQEAKILQMEQQINDIERRAAMYQ